MLRRTFMSLVTLLALTWGGSAAEPTGPTTLHEVWPKAQDREDARLGELKTLNGHFPFVVPENAADWYSRADSLRRRVLVSNGLWPMPEKTALKPVIFGKSQRDGFTVEKVFFESLPGHFVTGLLFRPTDSTLERNPAVLSPHGHGGRSQKFSDRELADQIAQGAEHFVRSGRMPKLARCAQLARMGCVTFIFDMLGYADSVQIPYKTAHRHADPRPEELEPRDEGWVFFSQEAELRLQSIMGLQTWNAVRSLDFLESLPDVDPDRIAITGNSGGGTQTILLGAIDDRLKASFPNGMVSTSMQGGCYCENCNYLRIGTGNVELAALFAPRPLAMTAVDDWTKEMMRDGYPELRWLYAMVGNEADVYCREMLHFKHNFNYVSRATMYQWMNRHLDLGLGDPVVEQDYEPLTDAETNVWGGEHLPPSDVGIPHERNVCRWFDSQARDRLEGIQPADAESLRQFRETFGGAWQVLFDQPVPVRVASEPVSEETKDGLTFSKVVIRHAGLGSALPTVVVRKGDKVSKSVIWTSGPGKSAAFDRDGRPSRLLKQLVDGGATVILPDLLGQGELSLTGVEESQQRLIDDKRTCSALTFGYNRTLAADRCADLLTVTAYAKELAPEGKRMLLASEGSAAWATPAAAIAGEMFDQVVIDTGGFRYADTRSYRDADFVPGSVKYGDIPTLLALRAPHALTIAGEGEIPTITQKAYAAANRPSSVGLLESGEFDGDAIAGLLD